MKININHNALSKSIKYTTLALFFLGLMFFFANTGWGTNTGGSSCDYYLWNGSENIGNITPDIYFQAISEGWLCRWTTEYYFGFYFWTVPLYLVFKHFGSEILKKPVPLKINLVEFIIAWGIYLFGLLAAVSEQGFAISFIIFYNALIGTFLLIAPMLGLMYAMHLYNKFSPLKGTPNEK